MGRLDDPQPVGLGDGRLAVRSHHHHAASFWPYRDLPNVLMVHYADLLADLEAQMRRVAAFTQIEVAEDAWPELVAAARFDAMKQEAIRNEEQSG